MIYITEFDTHSFCELPNGTMLFGKSTDELVDTLDKAASLGMYGLNCESRFENQEQPKYEYNR